jgi:flagellar hook-associated protein 3 FlgL
MTRVSEKSSVNAIQHSLHRTKSRLEDLQLKGSNLKQIQKPSDDPIGNTEVLAVRSKKADNKQYAKNSAYASTVLTMTENALADLSEVVMKAKELAISQASEVYDGKTRINIAKEIEQLRKEAVSIANRKLGNRFLFSGHATLTKPFNADGVYSGDQGKIHTEVGRGQFIPININGVEALFFNEIKGLSSEQFSLGQIKNDNPLANKVGKNIDENKLNRELSGQKELAKIENLDLKNRDNLISILKTFENGVKSNNTAIIQGLLDQFDNAYDHIVKKRTQVGALQTNLSRVELNNERDMIVQDKYRSQYEDVDVADLFSELSKQQMILDATYKSSSKLLNQTLMDYLR